MRVAVLTSGSITSPGWHVRDLARAAQLMDCELLPCHWRSLAGWVGSTTNGREHMPVAQAGAVVLDDVDVLLLRTMPAGSLEQIVFRMDIIQRLMHSGVKVVNPPRAIEMAVDKYLALSHMAAAGLPVPATMVCQRFDDAMAAFEQLGSDVVVKPLFGSEGFGLMRLTDIDLAARTFAQLEKLSAVIYLQQFIGHKSKQNTSSDLRLFVLDGQILAAMTRTHDNDWRTNISRGGVGHLCEPTDEQKHLAIQAAAACNTFVAGVDVMVDQEGRHWVIEVNAVPGWRELAKVTQIDVALNILQKVQKETVHV